MIIKKRMLTSFMTGFILLSGHAAGKVSEEEASRLDNDLTPFGAEWAGNADGTIPPWNPDFKPPASYQPGGHYTDPYKGEVPLLVVTAENMEKYQDKLTPGVKALFKAYPSTFRLPVYPT